VICLGSTVWREMAAMSPTLSVTSKSDSKLSNFKCFWAGVRKLVGGGEGGRYSYWYATQPRYSMSRLAGR